MKLELKHLTPYLPYNLKAIDEKTKEIRNVTLLHFTYDLETVGFNHLIYDGLLSSKHLPILRPLSDLTKEIEVNGEKFVPIVELYKYSNEYNYNKTIDYEFIDSWGAGEVLKVWKNRIKNEYTEFIYHNLSFRKDTKYNQGSEVFGMKLPYAIRCVNKIFNQYKLHELLFEWHFDVFGLIEKGLAIDINTLNQ